MLPERSTPNSPSPAPASNSEEDKLRAAAKDLELQVTGEQLQQLVAFRDALLKWNKVYNLTAVRQPGDMLQQHLIDCMAMVPAVRRQLVELRPMKARPGSSEDGAIARILDVGSGGGLPGVVLAVLMPQVRVDCVDAVAKKAAFIRHVAAELQLNNLQAFHSRVQDLRPEGSAGRGYDMITSRAFASLADFTHWTEHLLDKEGVWVAMKGQTPEQELRDPALRAHVFHVEPLRPPGLAAQRCLVWLRALNADMPSAGHLS